MPPRTAFRARRKYTAQMTGGNGTTTIITTIIGGTPTTVARVAITGTIDTTTGRMVTTRGGTVMDTPVTALVER